MVGLGLGDGKVIFLMSELLSKHPATLLYRKHITVVINLHLRLYVGMERAWF